MLRGVTRYPSRYDFVSVMRQIFGVAELQSLGLDESGRYPVFSQENDQSTSFHRKFYEMFDTAARPTYEAFIAEWAAQQVGEPRILYQAVPTFRIHLPGNVAVGQFHRDADYNHQQGETNFWLPVTEAFDTNSLWVESEPGRGDFSAVRLGPGEVYVFDGVNLFHGNMVNRTGVTRVSIDFRLIPERWFVDTDRLSVSAGQRMSIGHYWSSLTPGNLP